MNSRIRACLGAARLAVNFHGRPTKEMSIIEGARKRNDSNNV